VGTDRIGLGGQRGWGQVDPVHVGGRASRCTGSGGKGRGDGWDRLRGAARLGASRSRARWRQGESCTMSEGKGRGDGWDRLSICIFLFFFSVWGASGGESPASGRTHAPVRHD